ncbi:MAG: lysine biosynthesis protein LysW, partial [Saprospiraceae bacterium]|nr:lysine biosynthesis protein LysW [Saprospiraceae bacterium]
TFAKTRLPGVDKMNVLCVVCDADVEAPADAIVGEILVCEDCGTELEVTSLAPLTVEEAPEVEEDWGE